MSFNGDLYPTAGADVVMTTKGDMVDYNTSRQRLAIGSANQILQVKSSLPSWETLSTAGSVLTTQGDILYEGASALARLGFGTSGDVLTTKGTGANPVWETPLGSASLAYIGEVKLGSASEYIEQTTGFDTYSNVMIFFNLREVTGTFIPMCQFYSGGSLQTGTSYGVSECINGGSASKTNAPTNIPLDGNTDDNTSCVGYMSLYTAENQAPSDYSSVQGQYQMGLGSTSNAPDVQVQFCAKWTGVIEGIRFTETGDNAEFGADSAIKMFGVTIT